MAVALSRLKDTIKQAAKAVTNAAEECFTDGLRFAQLDDGIQFTIQVYDDSIEPVELAQSVDDTPETVQTSESVETPASTQQAQTYGRSSRSDVAYSG